MYKFEMMKWFQKRLVLPPYSRGFHLITAEITAELTPIRHWRQGQLQIFIQHTSAALTLNENADPTVRTDFESHFNQLVPENAPYFRHTLEGPDDMPAHLKASILGSSVQIPIQNGRLAMGTWQGIYLCEHRVNASGRSVMLTAWGA